MNSLMRYNALLKSRCKDSLVLLKPLMSNLVMRQTWF